MGRSELPSNMWLFGSIQLPNPSGILIGSVVFGQLTAECIPILYNGLPLPLKFSPSHVMVPYAHPSPQHKQHLGQLSRF